MLKILADLVPFGFTARTPGNFGPTKSDPSQIPYNPQYKEFSDAPPPGPTPKPIQDKTDPGEPFVSSAAPQPVPINLLSPYAGKFGNMAPIANSKFKDNSDHVSD